MEKRQRQEVVPCTKTVLTEVKYSDFKFRNKSVVQHTRKGEPQEVRLMGVGNKAGFQMLEGEMDSSVAPTMNVLQCASATCFCHRFAMLSCLNLIGWRGGWGESGQAGRRGCCQCCIHIIWM